MTPTSSQGSSSRPNSEYADVAEMFRELKDVPAESAQFQRKRDAIVERCLPLADHIARGELRPLHHPDDRADPASSAA